MGLQPIQKSSKIATKVFNLSKKQSAKMRKEKPMMSVTAIIQGAQNHCYPRSSMTRKFTFKSYLTICLYTDVTNGKTKDLQSIPMYPADSWSWRLCLVIGHPRSRSHWFTFILQPSNRYLHADISSWIGIIESRHWLNEKLLYSAEGEYVKQCGRESMCIAISRLH